MKIRTKRVLSLLSVSLLTSLLATACIPRKTELSCELPSSANSDPVDLPVGIYVDSTLSMRGFTQSSEGNYVKAIEELGEMFTLTDPVMLDGQTGRLLQPPAYFRLGEAVSGETIQEIDEARYREARFSDFYDPALKVTKLEAAIGDPDMAEGLTVIITDLYQAEDNIKVVTEKLKQQLSQSGDRAISLVGIRSPFKGTIYTEDLRNSDSFEYDGSHPFYVLLIGRLDEVHFYTDELLKRMEASSNDAKAVIYSASRFYQEPLAITRKSQENWRDAGLDSDTLRLVSSPASGMSDGKTNVAIQGQEIQPLVFSDAKTITLPDRVKLTPLSHVLPIVEIDTNVQVSSTQSTEPFSESANSDMFSLNEEEIADGQLTFNSTFDLSDEKESTIYSVKADIIPAANDGLATQSWWSDWNASDSERDGARTHNLENFATQLRELTAARIRQNPPVVGKLCYAVQVR